MDNKEEKPLRKRKPIADKNVVKVTVDTKKNLVKGQSARTNANQTEREQAFVREFSLDFNGSRAAIAAGYSAKTAHSVAITLLSKPHISKAIREFKTKMEENVIVTKQMITNELYRIAFADYTELMELVKSTDPKGGGTFVIPQFKATALLAKGMGKLIKSMKIGRRGVEVTIHSKEHALEMLAKHIGYFEADNDQKRPSSIQVYIPDNGRGDQPASTNVQINVVK